jgi:poly-D-alanine transfer protein DltD
MQMTHLLLKKLNDFTYKNLNDVIVNDAKLKGSLNIFDIQEYLKHKLCIE